MAWVKMIKKLVVTSVLVLFLLISVMGHVYASASALTITHMKAGMTIHLYQVATQVSGQYCYTSQFESADATSIDLNNLDTSEAISQAATTLKGYALQTSGIDQKASTSQVIFRNLDPGLYLVLVDPYQSDGKTYSYLPYLIAFPQTSQMELTKYTTTQLYKYSLVKHWQGTSAHPNTISVDVYNGKTLERTLTLTSANGYYASWQTAKTKDYAIVEHKVEGYTSSVSMSISQDGQYFVLTNTKLKTYNSKETPATSSNTVGESQSYNAKPGKKSTTLSSNHKITTQSVKTGDTTSLYTLMGGLLISGLVLVVLSRVTRN